jgi:very-short-patch-repair endonuclease
LISRELTSFGGELAKEKPYNSELKSFDSKLEEDFYNFVSKELSAETYSIQNQVKIGRFQVDFIITNVLNGKKIAVECEVPRYLRDECCKEAIDHALERKKLLEIDGWNIHYIKSTDWYDVKFGKGDLVRKMVESLTGKSKRFTETMMPTREELISLNPRLENRSKEGIDELINTIISKGYVWKEKEKYFYHKKMGMNIRTAGLDLFTPESFLDAYETWSNKNFAEGMRLGTHYMSKLLLVFFIDLCLGWRLLPLPLWIFSLFTLLVAIIVIYRTARKKVELGKKE